MADVQLRMTETNEDMPFAWRGTVPADDPHKLIVEVGDAFPVDDYNSPREVVEKIATDMTVKGLQLLGLSVDERKMVLMLIMSFVPDGQEV